MSQRVPHEQMIADSLFDNKKTTIVVFFYYQKMNPRVPATEARPRDSFLINILLLYIIYII